MEYKFNRPAKDIANDIETLFASYAFSTREYPEQLLIKIYELLQKDVVPDKLVINITPPSFTDKDAEILAEKLKEALRQANSKWFPIDHESVEISKWPISSDPKDWEMTDTVDEALDTLLNLSAALPDMIPENEQEEQFIKMVICMMGYIKPKAPAPAPPASATDENLMRFQPLQRREQEESKKPGDAKERLQEERAYLQKKKEEQAAAETEPKAETFGDHVDALEVFYKRICEHLETAEQFNATGQVVNFGGKSAILNTSRLDFIRKVNEILSQRHSPDPHTRINDLFNYITGSIEIPKQ